MEQALESRLTVEAQEVVPRLAEAGDGRAELEGVVRTMPVVVVEEDGEASGALLEAQGGAGGAPGAGAVAGAVVGIEALCVDAEFGKEGQSGVEEADGAVGGFIGEQLGKGEARMVINGNVEELPARTWGMIVLAVAGAHEASELLEVEMDEIAWARALGAAHGRRRLQGGEARAMAAQEAGDGSFGEPGLARAINHLTHIFR